VFVRTLGEFDARVGSFRLVEPSSRPERLYRLLLSHSGHKAPKELIADALWPGHVNGMNNLHAAVHDLRLWLGSSAFLQMSGAHYGLRHHVIDADSFESSALAARRQGTSNPRDALTAYERALSQYTGAFLPYDLYSEWVVRRRDELEQTYIEASLSAARIAISMKEYERGLALAAPAFVLDNAREDVARLIMLALASLGRRAEAVRLFGRLKDHLNSEIGCMPDPATEALRARIVDGSEGTGTGRRTSDNRSQESRDEAKG
jgi:DNA-binding SARP family transcriptional activator